MKQSKIPYERVAFVSFAKSTITTLKKRLDLSEQEARYFRTIHSMNFLLLGLDRKQVASQYLHTFPARFSKDFLDREMKDSGEAAPVAYDAVDDNFYYQMMHDRTQLRPFDYVPPQYIKVASLYLSFKQRYFKWLEENDYIDFIGMIERGTAEEKVPPVDLLCVDEWQDLSPLQVKQVTFWSQHIPMSIHAGDDDQTIHAWAGARHEDFLNFPTFSPTERETIILNKTYRLPTRVLDMSVQFIRRNKNRVDKDFQSQKTDAGAIDYTHIDRVADVLKEQLNHGTCKVLIRNRALRQHIVNDLMKRGVPVSTSLSKQVRAIAIIKETKDTLPVEDALFIATESVFPARSYFTHGGKKQLLSAIEQTIRDGHQSIPAADLTQYGAKDTLVSAIKNNDITLLKTKDIEPAEKIYKLYGRQYKTVEVQTIHQSKGSEADTVVVALDVTKRTYQESRLPDKIEEERRVWYVAMTRTKKNLLFLQPTYKYFYPSPLTDYVKLYLKNETNN